MAMSMMEGSQRVGDEQEKPPQKVQTVQTPARGILTPHSYGWNKIRCDRKIAGAFKCFKCFNEVSVRCHLENITFILFAKPSTYTTPSKIYHNGSQRSARMFQEPLLLTNDLESLICGTCSLRLFSKKHWLITMVHNSSTISRCSSNNPTSMENGSVQSLERPSRSWVYLKSAIFT